MLDLSIIIVNYNGLKYTLELLSGIKKHLAACSYECLVLDNGSRENEAIPLQKAFPEYHILRSETNLGFAGGNNRCLEQARGRYLYLLNNDTLLSDDGVSKLMDYMDRHPEIGACSPKILFYEPKGVIQFSGFTSMSRITLRNKGLGYLQEDRGQFNSPQPTHYLHGAAMMVSRTAFEKVGPMPEEYFLYYEEIDWCESFKRRGFELWYLPLSEVIHREGQSTGSGSPLKKYYLTRNRLLFARRNRNKRDFFIFALYFLFLASFKDIVLFLLKGKSRHAKAVLEGCRDFFLKRYGPKDGR